MNTIDNNEFTSGNDVYFEYNIPPEKMPVASGYVRLTQIKNMSQIYQTVFLYDISENTMYLSDGNTISATPISTMITVFHKVDVKTGRLYDINVKSSKFIYQNFKALNGKIFANRHEPGNSSPSLNRQIILYTSNFLTKNGFNDSNHPGAFTVYPQWKLTPGLLNVPTFNRLTRPRDVSGILTPILPTTHESQIRSYLSSASKKGGKRRRTHRLHSLSRKRSLRRYLRHYNP